MSLPHDLSQVATPGSRHSKSLCAINWSEYSSISVNWLWSATPLGTSKSCPLRMVWFGLVWAILFNPGVLSSGFLRVLHQLCVMMDAPMQVLEYAWIKGHHLMWVTNWSVCIDWSSIAPLHWQYPHFKITLCSHPFFHVFVHHLYKCIVVEEAIAFTLHVSKCAFGLNFGPPFYCHLPVIPIARLVWIVGFLVVNANGQWCISLLSTLNIFLKLLLGFDQISCDLSLIMYLISPTLVLPCSTNYCCFAHLTHFTLPTNSSSHRLLVCWKFCTQLWSTPFKWFTQWALSCTTLFHMSTVTTVFPL